jgi:hypothetical protein
VFGTTFGQDQLAPALVVDQFQRHHALANQPLQDLQFIAGQGPPGRALGQRRCQSQRRARPLVSHGLGFATQVAHGHLRHHAADRHQGQQRQKQPEVQRRQAALAQSWGGRRRGGCHRRRGPATVRPLPVSVVSALYDGT